MTHANAIRLPDWYAAFSPNAVIEPGPADCEGSCRIGPFTVFAPESGCAIARMGRPDRPGVVLFDGYLFDVGSLAAELGLAQPVSNLADLVAAAYQRWGEDVFDRLDGRYMAAIWDDEAERLLIGHDALGRQPVFYAAEPGELWFTSNLLALASSGRVANTPNRLSLALAMLVYWPEAGDTFFARIHRVRPGHYLDVSRLLTVVERRHFDLMPEDDEPWLSETEVLNGFEPALIRAVERCMALAPQGLMLSGGVDSVTVAALAAERWQAHGRPPLIAVSGRTGRALSYEERMQSQVADALKMPHIIRTTPEWTGGRDDISLSFDVTPELPGPSLIYWVGTYMQFYRTAAAHDVNTLLTGSGGDNWLGVADTHAADLMRRLQIGQLLRFMKATVATGGASLRGSAQRLLWSGGLRPHLDTLWARVAPASKDWYHRRKWEERLPAWLCPEPSLRSELVDRLMSRRTPALTASGRIPRSYYRHSLRSTGNPYVQYEHEIAYQVESRCGVRLLSPYHDRRLVSFFNRIPPRVLIYGDRYKGLLRPVVAKRFPQFGLEDQRKEYSPDGQNIMRRDLRLAVAAKWPDHRFEVLGRLGVVDAGRAEREVERADAHGFRELTRMFILMSTERWLRVHTSV